MQTTRSNSSAKAFPWRLALVVLLVVPLAACNRCGSGQGGSNRKKYVTPTETPTIASPSPTVAERVSQVSCRNSNVSLAISDQLNPQVLTDNSWHDIHTGARITTDTDGEAELNILDCMHIYVFKSSQLVRSACPKSVYRSGSVTCAVQGTSLFNNSCGSKVVIQTDGADISLDGTYLSVTYLPSQQITLVLVLKGKVIVQPVVSFAERTLGEPVEVSEGNFIMSVPEDRQAAIRNMEIAAAPGKALPFDQLLSLVSPLNLQPWLARIAEQARSDGISPPILAVNRIMTSNPNPFDCDCANVSAGLLTRRYQQQCKDAEAKLKMAYASTGRLDGKCDPVVSGPKARPR